MIVHIGLHKTGSTWLQREVFPRLSGVRYLDDRATRGALASIAAGTSDGPLALPDDAVVSSENLGGRLFHPEPAEVGADRVKAALPGATILMFTRDREAWRSSVYAQFIHEGGTLPPDRFWASPWAPSIEATAVEAAFREQFPTVHVLRYEDLDNDPLTTARVVAELCGGTLQSEPALVLRNRSLSPPSLRFLRWWNRRFRASRFNPSPSIGLSWAPRMRFWLQHRIDPLIPERWR